MRRYLKVFLILLIISLAILALFKWTALKNLLVNLSGSSEKTPSMIRALPFEILQEKKKERLPLIKEKLTPTQILIEDIVGSPKGAPLGKYVRVSVVLEALDKKTAEELSGRQGNLATLILDTIQRFPYERFRSRNGFMEFKKVLTQRIMFLYGDKIRDVSIVEFGFGEIRQR
ncbi:flagellar basal body-associated FliL family protein [Thermosulfurimonas dismutans]|uniref:Flagellar protein FliL n=1 Tax=Thermosulfurimonas dismutans TaxID=999894 RepID=A0A179D309_9BACT|nr:flagellar basal body-associated FliL family protein [Thermosulfurimonas dismutans]OAQ20181.1 hypothetical protein TDIS_1683 [Thermosulfurimonas dismutans]